MDFLNSLGDLGSTAAGIFGELNKNNGAADLARAQANAAAAAANAKAKTWPWIIGGVAVLGIIVAIILRRK